LTAALAKAGAAGRELAGWLAEEGEVDERALPRVAELVARAGGRDWALAGGPARMALGRARWTRRPSRTPPGPS